MRISDLIIEKYIGTSRLSYVFVLVSRACVLVSRRGGCITTRTIFLTQVE